MTILLIILTSSDATLCFFLKSIDKNVLYALELSLLSSEIFFKFKTKTTFSRLNFGSCGYFR